MYYFANTHRFANRRYYDRCPDSNTVIFRNMHYFRVHGLTTPISDLSALTPKIILLFTYLLLQK